MIFVVIPVFNRKEFTRNCLRSLSNQTYRNYKTIVVDDGSTDGTFEMISNDFPEVHIIRGDGNLWWAGATNAGISYVLNETSANSTDFILTLNNDLEVPENYLENLLNYTHFNERAILGSIAIDISSPEQMEFCGVRWNAFTGKYHLKAKDYGFSYGRLVNKEIAIDSDLLPGRGTLIPRKVFDEIGFFDSINFPQYAADEDFSLRAKKKGWALIIPVSAYVKSHIVETQNSLTNVRFSFRYFKHVFFSIRSPFNLKVRYRFALKNSPLKVLYFIIDVARISFSLTKALIAKPLTKLKLL